MSDHIHSGPSPQHPRSPWTEDVDQLLRQWWNTDGYSAQYIAATLTHMLGREVTRNSVIGRAHRIGLSQARIIKRRPVWSKGGRPPKPAPEPTHVESEPLSPVAAAILTAEPIEEVPQPLPPRRLTLVHAVKPGLFNVSREQCRWPLWGDGSGAPDYPVCGKKVDGESSWCAEHRARCRSAFIPPAKRTFRIPK